jgi:hypothetical protein
MRREWTRSIICSLLQIAAMLGLTGWTLWADEVPYREVQVWLVPVLGLWAGRAAGTVVSILKERRGLRNEVFLCLRWEDLRP